MSAPEVMRAKDHAEVIELNEGALPAVNRISARSLARMHERSACALVCRDDAALLGFALLFDETSDYESLNFGWFQARYEGFLYMDRIVVAPSAAGRGIGRALYRAAAPVAADRGVMLCCEVNLEPPNPVSVAFHERLGFRHVGEHHNDGKRVTFMVNERPARLLEG